LNILKTKSLIDRYEAASFIVNKNLNAFIRENISKELTIDQYSTMRYISNKKQCTASELVDVFCVGKSAISAIITRLADKNYIKRVRDQDDRRVVYLSLTEEGEQTFQMVDMKINEKIGYYLNSFSEEEVDSFVQSYERLANMIKIDLEKEEKNK
jgi:DNA-binding MarR family transcriptional regulator